MTGKGMQHHTFTNWAQTYSSSPELYFEPRSIDEIKEVLKLANNNGKKVKVIGSGLSPSDIACTHDYMICLRNLNKVLDIDARNHVVTVEAGATITDLNHNILPKAGLALSNLCSVSGQTVAGIIATASHGTGAQFGSFGTHVLEITIMKADGSIEQCSRTNNEEMFQAMQCHLGILGIILSVKLQCEPAFMLYQKQQPSTLENVLDNLDHHISSSEHFRFLWFPHTDYTVTAVNDRVKMPAMDKTSWFWSKLVGYYLLEFCLWISSFLPALVPIINSIFFQLCYSRSVNRIGRSDTMFVINCLFKQYVSEWAIPRQHTVSVLKRMKQWLETHPSVKAHFPVEVRFVKKDNIMMAPSGDEDVTYIGIISYRPYGKNVPREEWWKFFENLAMKFGGKPHWGKAHTVRASKLREMYPKYERFMEIRRQLDHDSLFINDYWKRILSG